MVDCNIYRNTKQVERVVLYLSWSGFRNKISQNTVRVFNHELFKNNLLN